MSNEIKPLSEARLKHLKKVLKKNKKMLLQFVGVREVGIGFKFSGNELINTPCITVFVVKKHDAKELDDTQVIPSQIDGIPIDIIESNPKKHYTNPNSSFIELEGGISISNPRLNLAGTMGCIVYDNELDFPMGLTNFHVVFASAGIFRTIGKVNDSIVQPALLPANSNNTIGLLSRGSSKTDSAVIRMTARSIKSKMINGFDAPIHSEIEPLLGGLVKKSGAATGITYGTIVSITSSTIVVHPNRAKQPTGRISDSGDSGSLWVTDDQQQNAVALHWGGEHTPYEFSHAVPIKQVLKSLNVHF